MMNANNPLYIDIHVLQTVPPSNINRDDTGSPKTARFGGVVRARVSSQAWKNATRKAFAESLDTEELGQRTKHAVDMIAERLASKISDVTPEEIEAIAANVLASTGIKVSDKSTEKAYQTSYLLFISSRQAEGLAELAFRAHQNGTEVDKKEAKAILDVKKNPVLNAIDISLFGRMVADAPDLNADAAVQVAHAIGISKAETEFDYFTAMDDRAPEDNAGAGMIGTVEFTSTTFYRYATIDVTHLNENLGSNDACVRAVEAFIDAFVTSMPTGKQNTFANRTLPSAVLVQLRSTQPVSLVNAFEEPVTPRKGENRMKLACEALVKQEEILDESFGVKPDITYVICAAPGTEALKSLAGGDAVSLKELETNTGAQVAAFFNRNGYAVEER